MDDHPDSSLSPSPAGPPLTRSAPLPVPPAGALDHQGRVALVTGAARGIGLAIARALHAGGARVAVSDRDGDAARQAALQLDASGATAMGLTLDVLQLADFHAARDRLQADWGGVDIVVNNAGGGPHTPVADITPQEWDAVCALNQRSVFFSCQVFGPVLAARGWGRIVNMASLAGQNGGTVAAPHYAAAKAGAILLTKYFAQQLAGRGVTVNALSPGPTETAREQLDAEQIARLEQRVPVGRLARTDEIAAAVCLLASDRGGFFVGATLDLNGGLYLR